MRAILMMATAVVVGFMLTGCATKSASIEEYDNEVVAYRMSLDEARERVKKTMDEHFSGRPIRALAAPEVGWTTMTRMALDTWTTTVTIVPIKAKVASGEVEAVRIETDGEGTSFFTGRLIYEAFRDKLRAELAGVERIKIAPNTSGR